MTTSWCAPPTSSSASSAPPTRWTLPDRAIHPVTLSLTLLVAALGHPAEAQSRYAAAQFDSARFRHIAQSEIQTVIGGRERRERVAVAGLLVVRGEAGPGDTLLLEAWYDSLEVRRSSREGTLEPDTDGIIGGRYRGMLAPDGNYVPAARPFVPDGVAEVVDLSRVLEELLPRLPPRRLDVGSVWRAPDGLEVRRLSDSVAGDTLLRFRARRTGRADAVSTTGDSGSLPAKQTTHEDEAIAWHPRWGLARRDRTIVVETTIPDGAAVGRPVRSRLEQRVVLERIALPSL